MAAVVIAALSFACCAADAQANELPFHGFAAGLCVSTEGVGIQGTTAIIPKTLNLNLGFNTIHLSHSFTSGNINYAANPRLASDVQAAQASVNNHLNAYQWWPVVGAGMMYRFD